MENIQNLEKILKIMPKLCQALHSDAVLFYSDEPLIATENRKTALLNDISLIKEQISVLEKILG